MLLPLPFVKYLIQLYEARLVIYDATLKISSANLSFQLLQGILSFQS